MKRLSFLVNHGENDCFMVHGLDWATYIEAPSWTAMTRIVLDRIDDFFETRERPAFLDFMFPDGSVVSLCA